MTRRRGLSRPYGRRGVPLTGRPRMRRLLRPLLGAALAAIGVLTPIEPATLPAPLDSLAPTSPILAQATTAVEDGEEGDCPTSPTQWFPSPDGSECHLDMAPCSRDPIPNMGDAVLSLSVGYPDTDGLNLIEYPGFCEFRVLEGQGDVRYAACQAMTGFAVVEHDVDLIVNGQPQADALCRLLLPAECPAGVRIDVDKCRAIERRSWSCRTADGYKPMNEYNKCYRPPDKFTATVHPACGDGAPDFVAQNCADYVGNDFVQSPNSVNCVNDFPTAEPPNPTTALAPKAATGGSNDYWCQFNAAYLNLDCHGTTACTPSMALCLKRATQTGGCSTIANTIRCRDLEADHHADPDTLTAREVRREGCQPCVLLPFSPVPPGCPDDLSAEVQVSPLPSHFDVLRARADYSVFSPFCLPDSDGNIPASCLSAPQCADPARGRVTWSSTHFSQVAVVNAPVILSVRDVPSELRPSNFSFDTATGLLVARRSVFPYPVSPAGGFGYSMARFGPLDTAKRGVDSVSELVGNTGECVFGSASSLTVWTVPQFRMTIRELWPDNPSDLADINLHFGPEALDWWRDLAARSSTAQKDRTLERGLGYWPDLSVADRESRVEELTQEVDCNHDLPAWCRWVPSRTGYFKVTGAAAWFSTRWSRGGREILSAGSARRINTYLSDSANRSAVAAQLASWGATPEEVGLADDLSGVLPLHGLNSDTRYSGTESRFSCGGTDIRVYCTRGSSGSVANYTETDPIGVAVHEVRVATRAPNS